MPARLPPVAKEAAPFIRTAQTTKPGAATAAAPVASPAAPDATASTSAPAAVPASPPQQTGPSGFPLPRFVSIKSVPVNVRRGPTREHEIVWTYQKADVPVEVIQEFENWRRIRDADGEEGWVLQTLLSGRRTALVTPLEKSKAKLTPLYQGAGKETPVVAYLEPNVLASVAACKGSWCRVKDDARTFNGWVERVRLWGVRSDEDFD